MLPVFDHYLHLSMQVVNRVQKLRKKAGLEPTDTVEIFYNVHGSVAGSDPSALQRIFESQVCIC